MMESLCLLLFSYLPTSLLVAAVKYVIAMPATMARTFLGNVMSPKPDQLSYLQVVEKPKWKGTWIGKRLADIHDEKELNQRINDADIIIFYAHGGGFRVGTSTMFMDVFLKWLNLLKEKHNMNALILSIEYSLAPEVTYPVPVLECLAAYDYLLHEYNVPPSKIVLAGDSAGGALCFETLIRKYAPQMVQDMNAPRTNFEVDKPAGVFLVSPLIVSNTTEWHWKECKDDIISHELVTCILKEYMNLPDINPNDLHLLKFAHLRSGFERFSPKNVMFYYGGKEVMRPGIIAYSEAMQKCESLNVVVKREELHHDWYFLRQLVRSKYNHIIDKADEDFASFAANAVKEYTK